MTDAPVAWVIGASRGIGRAVTNALAARNHRLVLTARSEHTLQLVADEALNAGAPAVEVSCGSVQRAEDLEGIAERAADVWGRIDTLIYSAGISPVYKRMEDLSDDEWDDVIDTNLNGAFRAFRAVHPVMRLTGGAIVAISSIHGSVAGPRLAAYSASKGGLNALVKTLAVEWAPDGIRVNAVAPGYVETGMTDGLRSNDRLRDRLLANIPAGRFASASEVAHLVSALTHDELAYMTGAIVTLDGGWTAQ